MKKFLSVALTIFLAFTFSACTKKACERICECLEEELEDLGLGFDEDDCIDDCTDDTKDEGGDCRKAIRDYGRCLKSENCDFDDCDDEDEEVYDECDWVEDMVEDYY